ncbi:MAG: putative transporter ATP-binding protein [Frankiales bacterium]|nr:putative transporter ATP-binding protein [Frankiales bacterium]
MASPPALVVNGLCKNYDGRRVLGPLSFNVMPGKVLAILGHNGSGKSTTLAAIAGVLDPSEGSVTVNGLELLPSVDQPDYRREIAYVPDEPLLFPDLTLRAHGAFIAGAWGVENGEDKLVDLLGRLGIGHVLDEVPATFSRGMRQKAGLAFAFLRPASLLLIDEPFSGLDDAGRDAFLELLKDSCAGGAAAVVATHARARVEGFATRAMRLEDGVVVASGQPRDVVPRIDDDA